MPTAKQVTDRARSQLGYTEPGWGDDSPGDQFTKYGVWFAQKTGMAAYRDTFWCEMFVTWTLIGAGFSASQVGLYGNCGPAVAFWKARGAWNVRSPRVGDVVYFDWDGDRAPEHVGFVEAVRSDGRVQTIEGNATTSGVRDGVKRLVRSPASILGYGRPPYSTAAASTPAIPTTPAPAGKDDDDMCTPRLFALDPATAGAAASRYVFVRRGPYLDYVPGDYELQTLHTIIAEEHGGGPIGEHAAAIRHIRDVRALIAMGILTESARTAMVHAGMLTVPLTSGQ